VILNLILGIVCLALIAATWVAGTFLAWPLWVEVLVTVLVVLTGLGISLVSVLRARSKARALEQDMMKQAEQQAMQARPDRRGEIMELQLQVKRALDQLRSSKLGGQAGGPLYALPWYMIVGPPGAGKTTALLQSGLSFPVTDPQGGGLKGVGGTRNCDWWFTNEGILLDTAGRYANENDDKEEWLAFLDMLKKYRSRMPINGVLVAVDIPSLVDGGEEAAVAMGRRLRNRIDEVMTRLKMVLPVYVMFTKSDLISGFSEFFGDLRRSERGQIWGTSFTLQPPDRRDPKVAFGEEFDKLAQTIFSRTIVRLGNERTLEGRQKIFHFPLEYRALKGNLAEFIGVLFEKNSFQETPLLRGIYFSSGTQEGRPVDRVLGSLMRAFNMAPAAAAPEAPKEQKSYFVTDMFRKVVFPDQGFAARSEGEQKRQLFARAGFAFAATLLSLLLLVPAGCSFANNRDLTKKTDAVATEATNIRWLDAGNIGDKVHKLDDVRDELRQLDAWRANGAPFDHRFGMYVGSELYVPLRNVYVATLHVGFAMPTKAKLEEELRATADSTTLSAEQYNVHFNRLKAYLQACDRERLDVSWESNALTDGWMRTLSTTAKGDKDILSSHAGYYVELMKKGEVPTWDCDQNLILRVRAYLKRLSAADRDYSALVRDANEQVPPITRETIFLNTAFGTFITSRSRPEVVVVGAYTKAGWELYVRDRVGKDAIKQLTRDRWVLGETQEISASQAEKQMDELRSRYFANYQRAWSEFLKDLDVRKPTSNEEALEELSALSEIPWPYQRLVKVVDENTKLEESPEERAKTDGASRLTNAAAQALNNNTIGRELVDAGVLGGVIAPTARRWESPVEIAFRPLAKFGVSDTPAAAGAGVDAAGAKPGATALAHYQERIVSRLVAVLTDLRDSKGRGVKAESVTMSFEEAIRGTNEILNPSQSGFTRPLLSPLLLNPLELAYNSFLNDQGGAAGGNWENDVWKKWSGSLADGYPFADTWKDVPLADYTAFFSPGGGMLSKFYSGNLGNSLELLGTKFVPTTRFGQTLAFTGPFLKCYDRGLEISRATFDTGVFAPDKNAAPPAAQPASTRSGAGPSVEFEVNLHSVSENISDVIVEVDGVSKTYKNGPEEWLAAKWPAETGKEHGSKIRIRGYSGLNEEIIRPGEWGFFRVMDAAKSIERGIEGGRRTGRQVIVGTWALRTQPGFVKLDIRPLRDENPFNAYLTRRQRLWKEYTCPRVMARGASRDVR
jgi:type VI secretion system protein ImpL